ncbi:hypothetical protein B0H21DRAFT_881665, partial [Amylocystis lapponica]
MRGGNRRSLHQELSAVTKRDTEYFRMGASGSTTQSGKSPYERGWPCKGVIISGSTGLLRISISTYWLPCSRVCTCDRDCGARAVDELQPEYEHSLSSELIFFGATKGGSTPRHVLMLLAHCGRLPESDDGNVGSETRGSKLETPNSKAATLAPFEIPLRIYSCERAKLKRAFISVAAHQKYFLYAFPEDRAVSLIRRRERARNWDVSRGSGGRRAVT